MPRTRITTAAASNDLLATNKFRLIPEGGALVSMAASCAANGGTLGLAINDRDIVQAGEEVNVEVAADVVDWVRDIILENEPVEGGQLYMPCGAAGTELQVELHIRYL